MATQSTSMPELDPTGQNESRQKSKISKGAFLAGGLFLVVSLSMGVVGVVSVSKGTGESQELKRLSQENELYQARIEHYAGLTDELEKELGSLQRLDRNLTTTFGLETKSIPKSKSKKPLESQGAQGGKGGPDISPPPKTERLSPGPLQSLRGDNEFPGAGLLELENTAKSQEETALHTPSILPVDGAWVASGFGQRISPFTGAPQLHTGVDFVIPEGTAVVATANGRVKAIRRDGANGLYVDVDHGNGLISRYAHLKTWKVEIRQEVSRGHVIAQSGMSGNATGPHLHYELIQNGEPVDPVPYLPKDTP